MKKRTDHSSFAEVSWAVAAILMCLFPPLGFVPLGLRAFLERRLHDPKRDRILGPAIGVLLFCVFELVLLTAILWETGEMAAILVFAPGLLWGGLMLLLRRKYRQMDARDRLAQTVILRGHVTDLGKIAECLGMPEESAARYLEDFIRRGGLKNCTLDREDRCIRVNAPWASVRYSCPYCGGDQIVDLGIHLTCKYCDSALDIR